MKGEQIREPIICTNNYMDKKRTRCEVYSRIVGYLRPVSQWNEGKQAEFKDRKVFKTDYEN